MVASLFKSLNIWDMHAVEICLASFLVWGKDALFQNIGSCFQSVNKSSPFPFLPCPRSSLPLLSSLLYYPALLFTVAVVMCHLDVFTHSNNCWFHFSLLHILSALHLYSVYHATLLTDTVWCQNNIPIQYISMVPQWCAWISRDKAICHTVRPV